MLILSSCSTRETKRKWNSLKKCEEQGIEAGGEDTEEQEIFSTETAVYFQSMKQNNKTRKALLTAHGPTVINLILGDKCLACSCVNLDQG